MPATQLEDLLYVTMNTHEGLRYGGISTSEEPDSDPRIVDICTSAGTAAHELGAESVERLLQHSVKMTTWHTLLTLCKCLPEAQTLSPTAAVALLLSAVEAKDEVMVAFLCRELPATAHIDVATCSKVLIRAIELKQLDPATALLRLPAAGQLPGTALAELLHAALKADLAVIVILLCGVPGAHQVDQGTVVELIHSAEDAWTDYGDFSREKPDMSLWRIADLKKIAGLRWRRSACGIPVWFWRY